MTLFLALSFYLIFIYVFPSSIQTRMTGGSCLIFRPFFMHPFGSFPGFSCTALEIGKLLAPPPQHQIHAELVSHKLHFYSLHLETREIKFRTDLALAAM